MVVDERSRSSMVVDGRVDGRCWVLMNVDVCIVVYGQAVKLSDGH